MSQTKCLSSERYEGIKQEIDYLLEECPGITYPIDPFEIAEKLHYYVVPYSHLSESSYEFAISVSNDAFSCVKKHQESGMLVYVIYYNDFCFSQERINWSIAHAIAHIYLGHHDMYADNTQEQEANFFAKYLLAPPALIHELHCRDYEDVAQKFNLSKQAAQYVYASYQVWLHKGPRNYQKLERKLIRNYLNNFNLKN